MQSSCGCWAEGYFADKASDGRWSDVGETANGENNFEGVKVGMSDGLRCCKRFQNIEKGHTLIADTGCRGDIGENKDLG